MLRVLHLLNSDHRRGAEVFALDLATAMTHEGVGVTVRALSPSRSSNRLRVVSSLSHGGTRGWLAGMAELRRLMRSHDVVVGHGGRTLLTAVLGSVGLSTPVVYRLIGDPRYWTSSTGQRLRVGAAMRRCAAVVTYYEQASAALRERYALDAARTPVIAKGIDTTRWSVPTPASRDAARRRFGIANGQRVVAYVGALSAEKNVSQLIRAVAGLDGARLLVAGEGPEGERLRSLSAEVRASVDFVGALEDPAPVYAAADVLGLTSLTEGVPTVLLEGASCGVPLVATEVGGNGEIVTATTGRLVPVHDVERTRLALLEVLDRRESLGGAAADRVRERFDLAAVARRWNDLLTDVVREHGAGAAR